MISKTNDGRETIAESWRSYRAEVIPADAGALQLRDTEATYYAGVHWLYLQIQLRVTTSTDEKSFEAEMIELGRELLAWVKDYAARCEAAEHE